MNAMINYVAPQIEQWRDKTSDFSRGCRPIWIEQKEGG